MATSMRDLLASGDAADFILICQGNFFFVHKCLLVDKAESLGLAHNAVNSQFLGGEACVVPDVSPDILRRVLGFLYRHNLANYPKLMEIANGSAGELVLDNLAQRFPTVDKFVQGVRGTPNNLTENREDGSAVRGEADKALKWSVLTMQHKLLAGDAPFPTDVDPLVDVQVLAAAETLEIPTLKEATVEKLITWLDNEMFQPPPFSPDLYSVADNLLKRGGLVTNKYLSICVKHFGTFKQDMVLSRSVHDLHHDQWPLLEIIGQEWNAERSAILHESSRSDVDKLTDQMAKASLVEEKLRKRITLFEARHVLENGNAKNIKGRINELEEQLAAQKTLNDNRSRQEGHLEAQLRDLCQQLRTLQEDHSLKLKSLTAENETLRSDLCEAQFVAKQKTLECERLEMAKRAVDTELLLKKGLASIGLAHGDNSSDGESNASNVSMRSQLTGMQKGLSRFFRGVNNAGQCDACQRRWNVQLERDGSVALKAICKLCQAERSYPATAG